MSKFYRLGWVILLLVFCTAVDQAAKAIAREALASSPPLSYLGGIVLFIFAENDGATLGLGASLPHSTRMLLSALTALLVLAATLFYTLQPQRLGWGQLSGLALISAGGVGNFLDRLFNHGAVVDFVSLGIGPLRTGIFNLADVAVFAGVLLFFLFHRKTDLTRES